MARLRSMPGGRATLLCVRFRSVLCAWAACAAFAYPFYWIGNSIVQAVPVLIPSLAGGRIDSIQVNLLGVSLMGPAPSMAVRFAIAAAAYLLAAVTLKRHRLLGGMAMAMIASAALYPDLSHLFHTRIASEQHVLRGAVCFSAMIVGLCRMPSFGPGYRSQSAFLVLSFALPAAMAPFALWGVLGRLRLPAGMVASLAAIAALGLAASLIAPLLRRMQRDSGADRAETPSWRWSAAGVAATALIVFALVPAGRAAARWHRERALELSRAAAATLPVLPTGSTYRKLFFQKGVNFTAEFPAPYSSIAAQQMLRRLEEYGVDAIALVPYGFTPHGVPQVRPAGAAGGLESDEGIEQLSRLAHSLGMKVMLKPQVWSRLWPAELDYPAEEARRRWFASYADFIEHYARLAARVHADIFCIGVEFARLTRHEAEWRAIIERVRRVYAGPLVYAAAQGHELESVAFWDALDYIGLSNYYPLPDDLNAEAVVGKIRGVQRRFDKPVLFAEAGFSSYEHPQRAPWDETPRRLSPAEQARCYEALLGAFYHQPWFMGVYWWKVGTNGRGGLEDGSHTPWRKPAMEVVKKWFLTPRTGDGVFRFEKAADAEP